MKKKAWGSGAWRSQINMKKKKKEGSTVLQRRTRRKRKGEAKEQEF